MNRTWKVIEKNLANGNERTIKAGITTKKTAERAAMMRRNAIGLKGKSDTIKVRVVDETQPDD